MPTPASSNCLFTIFSVFQWGSVEWVSAALWTPAVTVSNGTSGRATSVNYLYSSRRHCTTRFTRCVLRGAKVTACEPLNLWPLGKPTRTGQSDARSVGVCEAPPPDNGHVTRLTSCQDMRTIKTPARSAARLQGTGARGGGGGGGGGGSRVMVTRLCTSAAGVRNISVFCNLTYKSYSKWIL